MRWTTNGERAEVSIKGSRVDGQQSSKVVTHTKSCRIVSKR